MKFKVMKAKIGDKNDLEREGYIFEPKLDGYRALCYVDCDLKFISRNDKDLTPKYPELNFRKNIKAQTAVLDGEIVALDRYGRPNFQLLQRGGQATFLVFDILMKDEKKLINKPLLERKKILTQTVKDGTNIEKVIFVNDGKKLWKAIKKKQLEGVMAKREDSLYYSGKRTSLWLKIKAFNTIDCIVVGFVQDKRIMSSLAVGLYDDEGKLHYIGNVGTGYTERMIEKLYNNLDRIRTKRIHVINKIDAPKDMIWVKPKLVAEIKYLELTADGILRAPVFLRLRGDKLPKECTFEDQIKK